MILISCLVSQWGIPRDLIYFILRMATYGTTLWFAALTCTKLGRNLAILVMADWSFINVCMS